MKNKEKTSIEIMNLNYILALIPLIIYGFYKNGIVVYQKGFIDILDCIKIALIPFVGLGIGIIIELIFSYFQERKTKEIKYSVIKNSFLPLYGLILSALVNPNINILIFILIIMISLIIIKLLTKIKKISFNPISIGKLIFFVVLLIISNNSYLNLYEKNVNQAVDLIDIIFGRNFGGMFSTNIFFIIIAWIFLSHTKLYKKEIPLYMIISYTVLTIIFSIILGKTDTLFVTMFNSTVFFGAVFIAPEIINSPYTKKGKIAFGILLGIFTYLGITFINTVDGVCIAILFVSIFTKFIDNIFALK